MAQIGIGSDKPSAITVNTFGKGRAIYVATTAQPQIMKLLLRQLYAELGIEPGAKTPASVYARAAAACFRSTRTGSRWTCRSAVR